MLPFLNRITTIGSLQRQLVSISMPLKPKAAVTFDGDDGTSGPDSGGDRIAEPDAHHAPGSAVEAFAGLVHIEDVLAVIECVSTFVHDKHPLASREDVTNRSQQGKAGAGQRLRLPRPKRATISHSVSLAAPLEYGK